MQSASRPVRPAASSGAGAKKAWRRYVSLPAATILMIAFLLSRVLGMLRQVLFAALIGTHTTGASAYVTAFRAPDFVFNLVSGGAFASAFIPTFASYLAKNSEAEEAEGWRVASTVFYLTILLLLPELILAIILAPQYVPQMAGPEHADLVATAIPLTRIMLLQPLFMALITICQGVSNSYLRFTVPALAPLIYNLSIIVGILIGHFVGVTAVAWSVTVGAALQLALQLPFLPQGRRLLRLSFSLGSAGVHEIGRLMAPRLFGQAGIQATFIVTTYLANRVQGANPNPALTYGWTLILLPVGIFAAALGQTAFPVMSRQAAAGDMQGFARTVSKTIRMVFFLTLPAAAGLIILAPRVVRVLFAYGTSNDPVDIELITLATVYYAIGIPGHSLAEVLPRAFFAIRNTVTPVLVVVWTLAMAILVSVVSVKVLSPDHAVAGLAFAMSLAVLAEAINLIVALHRVVPQFELGPLGWALARANIATGVMVAGVGLMAERLIHMINPSRFGSFVTLLICVPLGAGLYLAAALLLRVPEATSIVSSMRKRMGR
jgi:putative peptidoglycan lipid II flippase